LDRRSHPIANWLLQAAPKSAYSRSEVGFLLLIRGASRIDTTQSEISRTAQNDKLRAGNAPQGACAMTL